ncbi:MAG: BMC domain-containing protein [Pseudomonadota bacterium]
MQDPAIGLIEYNSIAEGIAIADVICKRAEVKIIQSFPVCPGKYITLFSGDEASCEESLNRGIEATKYSYVDSILIPNIHTDVIKAIIGTSEAEFLESLGIIETFSIASCIQCADLSVKAANVKLISMRLAMGIGGKAFYTITGDLNEIEAAMEAGIVYAKKQGLLSGNEIITSPHEDLRGLVF